MIKSKDYGKYNCINKRGNYKNRYDSAEIAISTAKFVNQKNPNSPTKLVAYKCSHCHYYHLTSKPKRIRKYA